MDNLGAFIYTSTSSAWKPWSTLLREVVHAPIGEMDYTPSSYYNMLELVL